MSSLLCQSVKIVLEVIPSTQVSNWRGVVNCLDVYAIAQSSISTVVLMIMSSQSLDSIKRTVYNGKCTRARVAVAERSTMSEVYSDAILDTVETFLDTNPELEGKGLVWGERTTGESPDVRMVKVVVDGVEHLVIAKVVG